jgi:hypothetical protein
MKRLLPILLLCLPAIGSSAQDEKAPPAQDLEPVVRAFAYQTPEYRIRLRDVLFERAEWRNEFQFLRMPSFQAEALLTVRREGEDFVAQVLRPTSQVWAYRLSTNDLEVIEKQKKLPRELAGRACRLWQNMLLRTRFQKRNLALDGIGYAFLGRAPGYTQLAAESHNPEKDTKPDLLARVGDQLIAFVEATTNDECNIEKATGLLMNRMEEALKEAETPKRKPGEKHLFSSESERPAR